MLKNSVFSIIILLIAASPLAAQTYVAGAVDSIWSIEGSPYIAYGDIWIDVGTTLTIEPGVEVQFNSEDFGFTISGTLLAEGTEETPITFGPASTSWEYIFFDSFTASGSVMRWCIVQNGEKGVKLNMASISISHCVLSNCKEQGVYSSNSSFTLDSCTVENCGLVENKSGIYVEGGSPVIRGNTAKYSGEKGLCIIGTTFGEVSGNECTYNGDDGIYLEDVNYTDITRNRLAFNQGHGIEIEDCGIASLPLEISYNVMYANFFHGASCWYSSVKLINNTITSNGYSAALSYDGVRLYEATATLYNNIIDSNSNYGIYSLSTSISGMGYNNVWDNTINYEGLAPSPSDLSEDPLYENPDSANFFLQDDSPMIDAGNPASLYNDPDGTRNDIGAFYNHMAAVLPHERPVPAQFAFLKAYPNPFNAQTRIELSGAVSGIGSIDIYNILGRRVYSFEIEQGGITSFNWNGDDFRGSPLPSGIYFCRAESAPILKLMLLK